MICVKTQDIYTVYIIFGPKCLTLGYFSVRVSSETMFLIHCYAVIQIMFLSEVTMPAALSYVSEAQRPQHSHAYSRRSARSTRMHIRGAEPTALSCISGAQCPADIYKSAQLEKYIVITTSTCMCKHY